MKDTCTFQLNQAWVAESEMREFIAKEYPDYVIAKFWKDEDGNYCAEITGPTPKFKPVAKGKKR